MRRTSRTDLRYFAHAQPGFGPLLAEEIAEHATAVDDISSDGRSDVVGFEIRGNAPVLRTAEDVFVEIDRLQSHSSPVALSSGLVDATRLERALSVYATTVRPLRPREGFRAVVRVLSEHNFKRTDLRTALKNRIMRLRPKWKETDPADLELWCLETDGTYRLGLRLGKKERSARTEERHGALRPSVAAAMVRLAGPASGRLLDPMCGTGTIVNEARDAGWMATGADIDPSAIAIAHANGARSIVVADVLRAPYADGSFDAVVSNLPFGKQFEMEAPMSDVVEAIAKLSSGPIVLLTARSDEPLERVVRKLDVEVLGQPATLWSLST